MTLFLNILPFLYCLLFLWLIGRLDIFKTLGFSTISLQFAFVLKVVSGFFIFLIYTYYYPVRLEADTYKYFDDSLPLYNAFWKKPSDFVAMLFGVGCDNIYFEKNYYVDMYNWYRSYDNGLINDNRLIIRLNAVFRFFSGGNYHVHSLFMNFICFIGSYYLARFFTAFSNQKWKVYMAVFLLPSFVFWSAGILKEAVLIFAMGLFLWRFYLLSQGNKSIINLTLILVLFMVLIAMKMYVFVALFPASIAWWLSLSKRRTIIFHALVFFSFILTAWLIGLFVPQYNFIDIMTSKQHDFIRLAKALNASSTIKMDFLENNIWSFLKASPKALINCLSRPWPTELKSPLFVPAILENVFIISILIFSWIYRKSISPKQWKFAVYCLSFSLVLFVIIGLTTPILGAVVRYKIPAMPFLVFAALLFFDSSKLPISWRNSKYLQWLNSQL